MRNVMKILFLVIVLSSFAAKAQYDYTVDWSDTNTYTIIDNCGKVIPAQWSVKNDSCTFHSPYFVVEVQETVMISFNFRVNQSGNGDASDKCYLWHAIDDGAWILDTLFQAGTFPGVYPFSDSVLLSFGHYVQFRISMVTNDKTEFWAIKSGDGTVTDGFPLLPKIYYTKYPPEPMPVELLDFIATINDLYIELNWITASELNNDYFIIEKNRSLNDNNWSEVGRVAGNGTTNDETKYWLLDVEPYKGIAYYRLKQIDYDGALNIYSIIVVNWIESENFSYIIAPNPTGENKAILWISNKSKAELMIFIYDAVGNIIYTEESCKIIGDCQITIDLENYSSGVYYIVIKKNDKFYKQKIIRTD